MDIDAFILISGRSSRLGRDKAFVEFDGETLMSRAANTIETAWSPRNIRLVAAFDNQFSDRLPFAFDRPIVTDLKPGFGAWSGLHTGLAYARTEWAFVLACDMPFVSGELLRLLAASINEDHDAVAPLQPDGRMQPLCTIYRVKPALAAVETLIGANKSLPPLATIFDDLKTRIVHPNEYGHLAAAEKFFHNVNTPADALGLLSG